jgi:cytochrome bd ubiquinol oxidase subunit II
MTLTYAVLIILWLSLIVYAVLGGADFGGGIWDFFAFGPGAERQRRLIGQALGPVWEANHVWLIFAITGLFSAFPRAFDALGTLAFVPGTLALLAVVVRGATFAFAAHADGAPRAEMLFQRLFGAASVAAPFFFGVIAGGVASRSFRFGPFQLVMGALAVAVCTALAATFLALEDRHFRGWALRSVLAMGALALVALALAPAEAPGLFHGLTHRALPEVAVTLVALSGAHTALRRQRYTLARMAIVLAASALMWGWGFAQYPHMVGHLTVTGSAASRPELTAVTIALGAGLIVLVPALWVLFVAFRRQPLEVPR